MDRRELTDGGPSEGDDDEVSGEGGDEHRAQGVSRRRRRRCVRARAGNEWEANPRAQLSPEMACDVLSDTIMV